MPFYRNYGFFKKNPTGRSFLRILRYTCDVQRMRAAFLTWATLNAFHQQTLYCVCWLCFMFEKKNQINNIFIAHLCTTFNIINV